MAVDVLRENNPLPGVCGRVCFSPCEGKCEKAGEEGALAVRALKRFATEMDASRRVVMSDPYPVRYDEKVAVVGDARWLELYISIADHLTPQQVRHFSTDQKAEAFAWLGDIRNSCGTIVPFDPCALAPYLSRGSPNP